MKAGIFVPFASVSPESGVIALVANYLRNAFSECHQLVCNGLFSFCDRDAESEWTRDIHSCARCIADQNQSGRWAGLTALPLSSFLSQEEVWDTRRWALHLADAELLEVDFKGIRLYDLYRGTFRSRFGTDRVDLNNRNHAHLARKLALATLRISLATQRFNNSFSSDLMLVAGGDDFMTRAFLEHSRRQERAAALFKWEASSCAVRVTHPFSKDSFLCNFVLENISAMRADVSSWPPELLNVVRELLFFLDVSETQLALPLAR